MWNNSRMKIKDKVVVVTGAASGIGKALALRFAREGARGVVCADLDESAARSTAAEAGGIGIRCDVAQEGDMNALVVAALEKYGALDIFCSNAGIIGRHGLDASLREWRRTMDVNFMAHVLAARAVVPVMLKQGAGHIVATASAAGLLMQVDSATYTVSKHAAVAFAEWLSVNYAERGIKVSCLCPQGVRTPMLLGSSGKRKSFLSEGSVSAEDVATCVMEAIESGRFLILPHPEVAEYERRKALDRDYWLSRMRHLRAKIMADPALRGDD
jgi:NAD(P)-dependent dehydrogenase (short-subunit alcohol dehydrogenase family)